MSSLRDNDSMESMTALMKLSEERLNEDPDGLTERPALREREIPTSPFPVLEERPDSQASMGIPTEKVKTTNHSASQSPPLTLPPLPVDRWETTKKSRKCSSAGRARPRQEAGRRRRVCGLGVPRNHPPYTLTLPPLPPHCHLLPATATGGGLFAAMPPYYHIWTYNPRFYSLI